jgi:hypothetical protein
LDQSKKRVPERRWDAKPASRIVVFRLPLKMADLPFFAISNLEKETPPRTESDWSVQSEAMKGKKTETSLVSFMVRSEM